MLCINFPMLVLNLLPTSFSGCLLILVETSLPESILGIKSQYVYYIQRKSKVTAPSEYSGLEL